MLLWYAITHGLITLVQRASFCLWLYETVLSWLQGKRFVFRDSGGGEQSGLSPKTTTNNAINTLMAKTTTNHAINTGKNNYKPPLWQDDIHAYAAL
jgi:hypothetical protein